MNHLVDIAIHLKIYCFLDGARCYRAKLIVDNEDVGNRSAQTACLHMHMHMHIKMKFVYFWNYVCQRKKKLFHNVVKIKKLSHS